MHFIRRLPVIDRLNIRPLARLARLAARVRPRVTAARTRLAPGTSLLVPMRAPSLALRHAALRLAHAQQVRRAARPALAVLALVFALAVGSVADDVLRYVLRGSGTTAPTPGQVVGAVSHVAMMEPPAPVAPPESTPPAHAGKLGWKDWHVQRVVHAVVRTYQAVPSQTDPDNAVAASGVRVYPSPPYPIVANNSLPFGTKVRIRGTVYTVADRMHPRYGPSQFDILTEGRNFKLRNEPVEILAASEPPAKH